jgi:hypothetical protein
MARSWSRSRWSHRPWLARDHRPSALPILNRLFDHPIPGVTTLDGGRSLAQLARPSGSLQLDGAGLGPDPPPILMHDDPILGEQVGVGFLVRLMMLLLGLAGLAFAVSLLPGDLACLLGLLVLLTRAGKVAASQQPGQATVQRGEQVACLLHATGRLRHPLLVLLPLLGSVVDQPRLVGWGLSIIAASWSRRARRSCLPMPRTSTGAVVSVASRLLRSRRATAASWSAWSLGVRLAAGTSRATRSGSRSRLAGSGLTTLQKVVRLIARLPPTWSHWWSSALQPPTDRTAG